MSNPEASGRCYCARCTCRGLFWPIVLITLGVLFMGDQFGWRYGFNQLWPVILIVIGLLKVVASLAPTTGHAGA